MAIIRCITGADGKLTPVAVLFEPGDSVEFQSGNPTAESIVALEVRGLFSLDNLSSAQDNLVIRIAMGGSVTPTRTLPTPEPKLPPPPPEDGAFKSNPNRGTGNSIKVVIDPGPAD